jgi:hypothetical protein
MRVILAENLFESANVSPLDLISLIQLGLEGRHYLQTDPPTSGTLTTWLANRDQTIRDECEFSLNSGFELDALSPSFREIRVENVRFPSWGAACVVVPVNSALSFLRLPFKILVENQVRDANFLIAISTAEKKRKLLQFIENEWIEIEHGGGIESMRERILAISAQSSLKLRIWTFFDSDSLRPNVPSGPSKSLADACNNHVPFHMLKRRAIENYIPLPALDIWSSGDDTRKRCVRAFKKLNLNQRFHFNMKQGFLKDSRRMDANLVGDLFEGLDAEVCLALQNGFHVRLDRLYDNHGANLQDWWFTLDNQNAETDPMIDQLLQLL